MIHLNKVCSEGTPGLGPSNVKDKDLLKKQPSFSVWESGGVQELGTKRHIDPEKITKSWSKICGKEAEEW